MKTNTLLAMLLIFSGAAHAVPAVNVCDITVLGKDNRVITLRDSKARAWVAFSGANEAVLCVHNNKYLLFPHELKTFTGVTADTAELVAEFTSSGVITAYHIPTAGLADKIQPYRGEAAGLLFSYLTVARPGAGPSIVAVRPGPDFETNFNTALGEYAKTNWLWSSEKVRRKVADAVETARKKIPADELMACAPKAEVRLAFSRAYLPKYIDAVAKKDKALLESFSKPAVTLVCTMPADKPQEPRTVLSIAALLDSLK